MNSIPLSEASLYEIALNSEQPSLVLQVSPTTLKSVISSLIDLLVEQKVPAIVWAKLPRGEVWQSEIERYSLLEDLPRAVYQFKGHREEGGEDAGMTSTAIAPDRTLTSLGGTEGSSIVRQGSSVTMQLPPESPLRREYFVIVWSVQFQGIILAHRPRSAHIAKTTAADDHGTDHPSEEGQERRQHLLALFSFNIELIERILVGIETSLVTYPPVSSGASPEMPISTSTTDVITQWQELVRETAIAPPDPLILGQLFTRQLQRQEELWQRSAVYRKQSDLAESLQLQNQELNNAIRLKNDFLNNVGQELRTPLTTIKTALTLLTSPTIKAPQRQRYMDLIAKECDRQSSLITSLLDLVQLEQVVDQSHLQPIRLSDVVPGVVSMYQPVAEEKGVMLAYTVPEDLPTVSCMSNWLKQIVINLLNNGIKFTPRGGQVWVRAKQQGDYVQLEFRDTGIGITPGEIPKIFERFYRVRQSAEESSGAGLGLTIVQQLLMHCGGSISVKSKLGEGSTFNVLLPIFRTAE